MSNLLPVDNVDLLSIGHTNRIYSEEEEAYIRNVLLVAKQRGEDPHLIGRCQVALAPHKKLPPDVLRSIFHFCNETQVEFPLSRRETDLRLLHITHVCSAWRQLALDTPALWGNVGILLLSLDRSCQRRQALSSARQWFARAQDMPRSLFIYFDCQLHVHNPRSYWERILKFMALYRLRDIELEYPINRLTLKLPDHAWSSIERLHLIGNDMDHSSAKSPLSDFGSLPNLKHLKISDASNLRGLDNVQARWQQLRTLDIRTYDFRRSEIPPSSCLNVLRQCQLLEYCSLSLSKEPSFVESTVASGEEKIVLANMDHLLIKFFDGSAASAFLRPFVIPNITTFILETSLKPSTQKLNCGMPALIGIIRRSAGMRQIRRLEIDTSPLLDIGILLELLPSLEQISINSGHLTDNAIEGLSSGKLGPRLCDISSAHTHDDVDKILLMVESRYQNATKSSDSEQIESRPCPFKSISIPRIAMNSSLARSYRCRVKSLSLTCNANVRLGVGRDQDLEYDSGDSELQFYPEDGGEYGSIDIEF